MNPLTLLLFSTLLYLSLAFSESLTNWYKQAPPHNREMYDAVYANGIFTVVGDKGFIMQSPDGENWNTILYQNDFALLGITYSKGKFVAVGEHGKIKISEDGKDWKNIDTGVDVLLTDIISNGYIFVAVGAEGTILYSFDGITWNKAASNTDKFFFRVKYIDSLGKFFATGEDLTLLISEDGINWNKLQVNLPVPRHFGAIAYGNGKFIIVGSGGKVFISQDLKNWTEKNVVPVKIGKGRYLLDIIYAFGRFIAVGQYGVILISEDGENWRYTKIDDSKFLMSVIEGENFLLTVGLKGAVYKSETIYQKVDYPKIDVNLKSINFGTVLLNKTYQKTLDIKNVGDETLIIQNVYVDGDNKSEFSVDSGNCQKLQPEEECTLTVNFSPNSEGLKKATIRIQSNDKLNPIVSIGLLGIGAIELIPVISVDKTELSFNELFPYEEETKRILVKNTGYADLTIDRISINKDYFTYETNCRLVKPLESCYIDIQFSSEGSGIYIGEVSIESNDSENPNLKVKLTGNVLSPDEYPKVTPKSVIFGETSVNVQKKIKISIKNIGNEVFYSLRISLDKNTVFTQTNNCDNRDLRENDECEVEITFLPNEEKNFSTNLNINYKIKKFVLFRGETILRKTRKIYVTGNGKIVKDSTSFKEVKISVKNGKFAQPPEEFSNIKLPKGFSIFNGLAFQYAVVLEEGINNIEVNLELPFIFDSEKMGVFKCINGKCSDITSMANINGKNISFSIVDGGDLDGDREKNGIIEDPIVIAQIKESTDNTSNDKSTSSGGGGCKLSKHYELSLLVVIIGFLLFRRLSRSR